MKKLSEKSILLYIALIFIIAFISGYYIASAKLHANTDCNSIALDYLEYAKQQYNSNGADTKWKNIIDIETQIHNLCSSSSGILDETSL